MNPESRGRGGAGRQERTKTQPQRGEGPADVGRRPMRVRHRKREEGARGPSGGTANSARVRRGRRVRAQASSPTGSPESDVRTIFGVPWDKNEALRHSERCRGTPCGSRKEGRVVAVPDNSMPPLQSFFVDLRVLEASPQGE